MLGLIRVTTAVSVMVGAHMLLAWAHWRSLSFASARVQELAMPWEAIVGTAIGSQLVNIGTWYVGLCLIAVCAHLRFDDTERIPFKDLVTTSGLAHTPFLLAAVLACVLTNYAVVAASKSALTGTALLQGTPLAGLPGRLYALRTFGLASSVVVFCIMAYRRFRWSASDIVITALLPCGLLSVGLFLLASLSGALQ